MSKCPNNTDQHHYALDKSGTLVHLIKGDKISREDYFCVGCGKEVRPIMGDKRDWHFRHKAINPECNNESWLHKFSKKFFIDKFKSKEPFEISYWVKEICPQYENCSLCSNSCFREGLQKIDIKKNYDACVEEETNGVNLYRADVKFYNSKNPNIKPLFLEIAYKHECEQEKIESGIQIVELKINKDEDLKKPIVEQKNLFFDYLKGNPYSDGPLPDNRFYNFERILKENFSRDLWIYCVGKDKDGRIIQGPLGIKSTFLCNDYYKQNLQEVLYLLLIPEEYIKENPTINFWFYGLLRAALSGVYIRNCAICSNCFSGRGGCVKYGNFMNNLISVKEINKDEEAIKCGRFTRISTSLIKRTLNTIRPVPYKEIKYI